MDSKLKGLALAGSVAVILLVALAVLYSNGYFNRRHAAPQTTGTEEESAPADTAADDPHRLGTDLSAFLWDPDFFDPEEDARSSPQDTSNHLSIITTSVEKDLRVQIVDIKGELVTGQTFYVRLTDSNAKSSDYKDLDEDGLLYMGELAAGDYRVELLPIEGFKVPSTATKVKVKDRVEYVVIPDISLLLHTEDEIEPRAEDTEISDAIDDADETEIVDLQPSDNRTMAGIDVSKWQGEIDWKRVAQDGVEFAIIRCGYRGSKTGALVVDPYFVQNIAGAKEAGLKVGVYFFTQAVTEAEAVEEASAAVSLVREYAPDLPIYIDTEGAGGNGRADGIDKEMRTKVCEAFCRTVVSAGYDAGVYASRNWFYHNLETSRLDAFETWLAEYRSSPLYTGYYHMWQYTSRGSVDGISGNVDLDIRYASKKKNE
ncbi:MAG: glycoside hydrolase family 25 protein [Lachnospiraceae bacterium]|nr:glycoside hydrolase family 25 protein [Lachnospiraceae bacterium]